MTERQERRPWGRFDWTALAALAACSAALRCFGLERVPPALWFDEGLNGCDVLALLHGGPWRLVFPDVFPREPLLIYLMVPLVHLFGPRAMALRLAAALVGTAAPLCVYIWLRQAANRRTALCAAFFLAGMRRHIHFSRIALRTIWTPTLSAALFALLWKAFRSGQRRWAAAAGAVFGLGFYTYLSWYFLLPVAAAGLAMGLWKESVAERRKRLAQAAAFALATLLVAAPMFIHYARFPGDLTGRPEAVSPFAGGLKAAWTEISKNARDASMMLFLRGDHVTKQNIPWQPTLEPIGAALFLLGLLRVLWTLRRRSTLAAVLLLWLVCGTAPTVLSKTDSPNFLRTLILTPCVAAIVGWGADGMARYVGRRFGHWMGNTLAGVLLAASVTVMMALYFGVWAKMPELWNDFSGQADQIARYALTAKQGERVFVPAPIAKESYTYRFLAAGAKRASIFSPATAFGKDPEPGVDHLIVESDSIDPRVRLAIARQFPRVELAAEFPMEGLGEEGQRWVWARAWRIKAADLLDAEAARRIVP